MKMGKLIRDSFLITKIILLNIRGRLALYLLSLFLLPLGIMFILFTFSTSQTPESVMRIFSGTLVFALAMTGINDVGQGITTERFTGAVNLYRTSPISPVSYILAVFFSSGIKNVLSAIVILSIGVLVFPSYWHFSVLALSFLLLACCSFIGIGSVIGTRSRSIQEGLSLSNFLSLIVILLSPVYYDIESLPKLAQYFSLLLPTTHASQGMYLTFIGTYNIMTWCYLGGLIISTVVLNFLGFAMVKWRET